MDHRQSFTSPFAHKFKNCRYQRWPKMSATILLNLFPKFAQFHPASGPPTVISKGLCQWIAEGYFMRSFCLVEAELPRMLHKKICNDVKSLSSNNLVKYYSNNLIFCIRSEVMHINKSLELEFAISNSWAPNASSKVLPRKIPFFDQPCHTSQRVDWLWLSATL